MSVIDFSNFFATLPTKVSFSLNRKANTPGVLCWFNPRQSEDYFPEPEEILRTHWKITDKDLKAFSSEQYIAKIMKLLENFSPSAADDRDDCDTLEMAVGKDSASGEWIHVFLSQFEGLMCIGSVKEARFLNRMRTFYLLSKVIDLPTVDHNTLGGEAFLPCEFLYTEEPEPWQTEFIRGKDMRDAQAKVASFLVTRPLRYTIWAVCMQVFGEEFYATIIPNIEKKGYIDHELHHVQEHVGNLASVCPPVQICLFWRE